MSRGHICCSVYSSTRERLCQFIAGLTRVCRVSNDAVVLGDKRSQDFGKRTWKCSVHASWHATCESEDDGIHTSSFDYINGQSDCSSLRCNHERGADCHCRYVSPYWLLLPCTCGTHLKWCQRSRHPCSTTCWIGATSLNFVCTSLTLCTMKVRTHMVWYWSHADVCAYCRRE